MAKDERPASERDSAVIAGRRPVSSLRVAVNGWFLGQPGTGSGHYLNYLLHGMAGLEVDHQFLLVTPAGVSKIRVPGLSVEHRAFVSSLYGTRAGKVWFEQVAFPRVCREWQADLAHVPYWGSPLHPGVPTVVTIHDLIPLLLPAYRGSWLVRLYTRLVSASAQRALAVLTDSLASKLDIETHLALPSGRVHCVYLAAPDGLSPQASPDDGVIRRGYCLPDRYVLYLAGHDLRKNVASLVKAFATVVEADADIALVVGGRLPERDTLPFYDPRPLVHALGLDEDVRFIGWVDEAHKPALYRGAACAVFPSQYEGFGLPVLEALACGTPLVASNASSLPEVVGDAGFAVDPDDLSALAGAILACLVDEPLAAELRRRGPVQAARFSWAQAAQETLKVYGQVVADAGDGGLCVY